MSSKSGPQSSAEEHVPIAQDSPYPATPSLLGYGALFAGLVSHVHYYRGLIGIASFPEASAWPDQAMRQK